MVFSCNISSSSSFLLLLLLLRLRLRLTDRTCDPLQFTFNFRNYKTFRQSGRGIGATYSHYLHWATNKTNMHTSVHYPSGIRTHDTRLHLLLLWSPPIKFFDYTFVGISDYPRPSSLPLLDFISLPPNTYFTRLPSLKQLITVKYETALMCWVHSFYYISDITERGASWFINSRDILVPISAKCVRRDKACLFIYVFINNAVRSSDCKRRVVNTNWKNLPQFEYVI
jgi:hypothetical protein